MQVAQFLKSFRYTAAVLLSISGWAASASAASIYGNAVLAQNPLEYWTLDDASKAATATAVDSTGHNNGTYNNGVTNVAPGAANIGGTAAGFSGSGSVAFSNNATYLPAGGAHRTLILWEKTTATSGEIFNYGTQGVGNFVGLDVTGSGKAVATDFGADAVGSGTINDGSWHMIALTISSSTWTTYSDVAGVMTPGTPNTIATNTVLGGSQQSIAGPFTYTLFGGGTAPNFVGSVDEVAIFGNSLTQSDLQTIFNAANVPEPCSLILCGLGAVGLCVAARRRRVD